MTAIDGDELDPNREELRKIRLEKANSWLASEVKRLEKENEQLRVQIEASKPDKWDCTGCEHWLFVGGHDKRCCMASIDIFRKCERRPG